MIIMLLCSCCCLIRVLSVEFVGLHVSLFHVCVRLSVAVLTRLSFHPLLLIEMNMASPIRADSFEEVEDAATAYEQEEIATPSP